MKTRRRAYSELTNELAALPKDNLFTGVNVFRKSQSDGTKLSEIEVNPDLTNPLISITKKTEDSGIVVTDSTKINPDSIIIRNDVFPYETSMTHDGFKVNQAGIYTEYLIGSISHNTGSGAELRLTFPDKSGVLAVTDDIDVKAAGNNKFTGSNTFTKIVTFGDINASTGTAISTYGAIQFYNGAFSCGQLATGYYDDLFKLVYKNGDEVVKFPHGRSGTLALTSDIGKLYRHDLLFYVGNQPLERFQITVYNSKNTKYTPGNFFMDETIDGIFNCGFVVINSKTFPIVRINTSSDPVTVLYLGSEGNVLSKEVDDTELLGTDTVTEV